MAVTKFSVSMESDLYEDIKEQARAMGMSVSAWLADLVRERTRRLGLRRVIDEYKAEFGEFTDDEIAEAQAWLDDLHREMDALRREAQ